jgi:hypothetical protein
MSQWGSAKARKSFNHKIFLQKTAKEAKVLRYQSYSEGWLSPVSFAPGKIMRAMPFFRIGS